MGKSVSRKQRKTRGGSLAVVATASNISSTSGHENATIGARLPIRDLARSRILRVLILLAGLTAIQFILYGPSLLGRKLLLPLDTLALPGFYFSHEEAGRLGLPHDWVLTDAIDSYEVKRQFVVSQVRAGHIPLWDPYNYCGAPCLAANQTAVFSPYRWLDYLWPGPRVLAWDQLLMAWVTGTGAYLFFRRAARVGSMPAMVGAWAWSVAGCYIRWAGSPLAAAATWLPWLMVATEISIARPGGGGPILLALSTAFALLSGHAATAGQMLLGSAVYFLWRIVNRFGLKGVVTRAAGASSLAVILGWSLGILLTAPQTLPTIEYLVTGHRIADRLAGRVETPPQGFEALPEICLPDFNGGSRDGAYYFGPAQFASEGCSTGFVGVVMALVLAPVAISSSRHRSLLVFCVILALFGAGQVLGIPLLRQLYEKPPMSLLRNNRLIVLTGFAVATAAVIGLDQLFTRQFAWRNLYWMAAVVPAALGIWCLVRAGTFPVELEEQIAAAQAAVSVGYASAWETRFLQVAPRWYPSIWWTGFGLCALATLIWLCLHLGIDKRKWFAWTVSAVVLVEVIWGGFGVYTQSDPALYYPKQLVLAALAKMPSGRIAGDYFPACIPQTRGLLDVRGYDGVDPGRLVDVLRLLNPTQLQTSHEQSLVQWFVPANMPSPLADMINLRYLVIAGKPSDSLRGMTQLLKTEDCQVLQNGSVLPRAFVPRRVEVVNDNGQRLRLLARPTFDPRAVAYIESTEPVLRDDVIGNTQIVNDQPSLVTLSYTMKTPGLIVLSDLWDAGWEATLNGQSTSIFRTNHAFRGVLVPRGTGVIEFRYRPKSFLWGIGLFLFAGTLLAGWSSVVAWRIRSQRDSANASPLCL